MDIAVMGTGGVGGYFGGMLTRAGNKVTFVARGDHLGAIRNNGLRVLHHHGDFTVVVAATDNPRKVGPVELILFTVKAYDTMAAIPVVARMLGPETSILTLQNGVDSYRILAQALGKEKILPGAAYIESRIHSPGVVHQTGDVVRIVFGEVNGVVTPRATRINKVFRDAGINAELSRDVLKTLWTKFLFITSVGGLTSACRTGLRALLEEPEYKGILVAAMKEIEALGRAHGIDLDSDVVQETIAYVESAVKNIMASMHVDLERGRRLELDIFNGAVVRMGKEVGVNTPVNELLYLTLKPHINGRIV